MQSRRVCGKIVSTDKLDLLKEEFQILESDRAEIRKLGKTFVKQGMVAMQPQLDEYQQIEYDVLLRLSQMQVRLAQDYRTRPVAQVISMSGSTSSRIASIKSTTQRHLDYLDNWRLNLARLDYLIKTTDGIKRYRNAPDPVNEMVISFFLQFIIFEHFIHSTFSLQAELVRKCRLSYDLTQDLSTWLASESTSNEAKMETLARQTKSLQNEFLQLEMLAKKKVRNLQDGRYVVSFIRISLGISSRLPCPSFLIWRRLYDCCPRC